MKFSLSPFRTLSSAAPYQSVKAFGKKLGLSELSWIALASLAVFVSTCVSIALAIGIFSIIAFKVRSQDPVTCRILALLPLSLLATVTWAIAKYGIQKDLAYMFSCWGLQFVVGICAGSAFFTKDRLVRSVFVTVAVLISVLNVEVARGFTSLALKNVGTAVTEMDRRGMIHAADRESFQMGEVTKVRAALDFMFYPSLVTKIGLLPL